MLRPPKDSVIALRPPKSSVIILKPPKSSNTQVPKKMSKRKATQQIDAGVRAPAHPPTTEPGEDGPLPQVT